MGQLTHEEVHRVVRQRGPLIPNEIRKILGLGDTMLLGAMLSELSNKGLVKISSVKVGGSPVYYDPQQPASLERASQHLNEKDQRTWQLLKREKVLRDSTQDALTRVSLRNIKDFAKPLTVRAPEGEVLFWKYYLVSDAEAETLIKEALGMKTTTKPPEAAPKQETKQEAEQPAKTRKTETKNDEPRTETQRSLAPEPVDDPFYNQVKAFFDTHGIRIKEQKVVRKKSEIDLVITMHTPVGAVDYYCKAKSKKKSNDGDLANAKLEGAGRNLPVVYLTTGEVTKKAQEKLQKEFKGLVLKRL